MWEYYCRTNLALGHWGNVGNFLHHIFSAVTLNAWYLLGIECYGGKNYGVVGKCHGDWETCGKCIGENDYGVLGKCHGDWEKCGKFIGENDLFFNFLHT